MGETIRRTCPHCGRLLHDAMDTDGRGNVVLIPAVCRCQARPRFTREQLLNGRAIAAAREHARAAAAEAVRLAKLEKRHRSLPELRCLRCGAQIQRTGRRGRPDTYCGACKSPASAYMREWRQSRQA